MSPFGWWIALYFALATLAAGAGLAACAMVVRGADARAVARTALIAAGAIGAGMVALILDLERPAEFWLTLTQYNHASWISRGSRIIAAFALLSGALSLVVWSGYERSPWIVALAVAVGGLAVMVAIYPALVLDQAVARPAWDSGALPLVFAAGSLHFALALAGAPPAAEIASIALEAVSLAVYVMAIAGVHFAHLPTVYGLLAVAALGSWVVPLALLRGDLPRWLRVAVMAVGCFGLRAAILLNGQSVQVTL